MANCCNNVTIEPSLDLITAESGTTRNKKGLKHNPSAISIKSNKNI